MPNKHLHINIWAHLTDRRVLWWAIINFDAIIPIPMPKYQNRKTNHYEIRNKPSAIPACSASFVVSCVLNIAQKISVNLFLIKFANQKIAVATCNYMHFIYFMDIFYNSMLTQYYI